MLGPKYFLFHRIFKTGGGGGAGRGARANPGSSETPEPTLDPPLVNEWYVAEK